MRKILITTLLALSVSLTQFVKPAHADNDEVLHGAASFVISTVAYNFYIKKTNLTENQAKVAAFLTTLAIGAIKEAVDDDFSGSDFAADAGGAAIGAIIGFEF